MTLKGDFSMDSKMYGFPYENKRFHVSLGTAGFGGIVEMTFKVDLVWKAKCMDFH